MMSPTGSVDVAAFDTYPAKYEASPFLVVYHQIVHLSRLTFFHKHKMCRVRRKPRCRRLHMLTGWI